MAVADLATREIETSSALECQDLALTQGAPGLVGEGYTGDQSDILAHRRQADAGFGQFRTGSRACAL
jgi:hypothetical protein